jgi:hypothetical protein
MRFAVAIGLVMAIMSCRGTESDLILAGSVYSVDVFSSPAGCSASSLDPLGQIIVNGTSVGTVWVHITCGMPIRIHSSQTAVAITAISVGDRVIMLSCETCESGQLIKPAIWVVKEIAIDK